MEIMAVVFIIAVLSMFAIPTYIKAVEKTYNKQALAMIQLILTGEKMYQAETGTFVACAGNDACAAALRIDTPGEKWTYRVSTTTDTSGTIQAQRAAVNGRRWVLDFDVSTPVDTMPVCTPAGIYCR